MERAGCTLCVLPSQCREVLCILAASRVMRSSCDATGLPVYHCLGEQQAKGSSGQVCGDLRGPTCGAVPNDRHDYALEHLQFGGHCSGGWNVQLVRCV